MHDSRSQPTVRHDAGLRISGPVPPRAALAGDCPVHPVPAGEPCPSAPAARSCAARRTASGIRA